MAVAHHVTTIPLGRGSPTRLDAAYPLAPAGHGCRAEAPLPAYLALLRAEIARFTLETHGFKTRLCCSDPRLTAERCYLLRCPVQSGRSSSAALRHHAPAVA